MWQAEADTELTLSALPTTAVGQKALALAKTQKALFHGISELANSLKNIFFTVEASY